MKIFKKFSKALALIMIVSLAACQTNQEDVITDNNQQSVIRSNSPVSNLMQRVAMNDGSHDNIIDNASCLNVKLPVTVVVNGQQVVVNSDTDFLTIEEIFDQYDDDTDTLEIQFPITVVLADFSEMVINDATELAAQASNCLEENAIDLDIECIDFQYPITGSVLDANNNVINTITINNDNELYDFIANFDPTTSVAIDFPISVILPDGTNLVINDLVELETAINQYEDACDEDDDNDYNDDDCLNCTTEQLATTFSSCIDWLVEDLEINGQEMGMNYTGYSFNFEANGNITVTSSNGNYTGTWTASGTGTSITVSIAIDGLTDFNGDWILHEIDQETQEPTEISLERGNDELSFESNC